MGVEDGVEAADASRMACAWKSGPVSMTTLWPLYAMRMEGRVRRLRGSRSGETAETQTAQSQPRVGMPIEVPVPRKVSVACMRLADDAGSRPGPGCELRAGAAPAGGGAGEGRGDFEEAHADLEERVVDELRLGRGQVALGFFGEDGEHVDALARAHQVDLGLLALVGGAAELHDGGHVDGLDDLLEGHRGWVIHAGIGGADGGIEPLRRLLVGGVGLFGLPR